jgi:hypothetical protein
MRSLFGAKVIVCFILFNLIRNESELEQTNWGHVNFYGEWTN